MDHKAFLTIYIPTFNRANILQRNLGFLLPFLELFSQTIDKDIKVLVSDNCSTDNTESIIKQFNYSCLIYHKNSENIGALRNFYQSVDLCNSDYIWVLGDDDNIINSYFKYVLEALVSLTPDFLFLGSLGTIKSPQVQNKFAFGISSLEELFLEYPLTALAHISRIIYKKKYLNSLPENSSYTKDYYIWSWISPAVFNSKNIHCAYCSFPAISVTKDGGMDEWAGKTPLPRLLEFEDYVRKVATTRQSLKRMYLLNYFSVNFPFQYAVFKAIYLRPDMYREITLFVRRCRDVLGDTKSAIGFSRFILLLSKPYVFASYLLSKKS